MESGNTYPFQALESRVNDLMENGKVDEALKAANTSVEQVRLSESEKKLGKQELSLSLEIKADLHRQIGEYEIATQDYEESLSLLGNDFAHDESIGRICASLAVLHDLNKDTMMAKSRYERAIACFERLSPPAILDVADLSNNLAFVYQAEDNFDHAETLFLKALRISHEHLGQNHEQTALLCNNVGSLYFKVDYEDQAREMHVMALDIRMKIFGENHLETAQSYANLALVMVKKNDAAAAKNYFDKALDAYEENLEKGLEDYEIVAANYREVLESLDDSESLKALNQRTKGHL